MKKRDANIEVLHVVCMYGIVLLHVMNDCGHHPGFISSPLHACVCATWITWLAGSMFPVLLLHGHGRFFKVVESCESALIDAGHSISFVFLVVSLAIFLVSCVVDVPRRLLLGVVRRCISHRDASKSVFECGS